MPATLSFRRQREDYRNKGNLGYKAKPCLSKEKKKKLYIKSL
jgi:hypothetical protein